MLRYDNLDVSLCGHEVIEGVCLELGRRGTAVFLGPSGCGKTTLLRATVRLDTEDPRLRVRGTVELEGTDVRQLSTTELRQKVGLVMQRPVPFPGTALENVCFALRLTTRLERGEILERAREALSEVGLEEEHYGTEARCLSGGELQRLAVARAVALRPRVVLLDEPSSGLDPLAVAHLERLILELSRRRLVVVVTHDVILARRVADEVFFFSRFPTGSRLVESGPAERFFGSPSEPLTRRFLAAGLRGAAALTPQSDEQVSYAMEGQES